MNVGSRSVVESMVCNIVARNITQPIHVIAHEIYTAHVKPLEDALAKADADKAALVEALEECVDVMETTDDPNMQKANIEALKQARAALARVKGMKKGCFLTTGKHATKDAAVTAWGALPRALTWTTEPPKVAGFYFAEQTMDDGSKEITPIEVFPQYHWRHTDWERRYGKLPCLLCLGGFGVGPISKYSRFAGPIPQPKEQTP